MLLRTKDKNALLEIFSVVEIPLEVWAYGSRVSGSAHEGSDLDLVVRSQNLKPLPRKIFNGLREKIMESNIPILVELHDWGLLPEYFHQSIGQQYELFYTSAAMLVSEPNIQYKSNSDPEKDDQ